MSMFDWLFLGILFTVIGFVLDEVWEDDDW